MESITMELYQWVKLMEDCIEIGTKKAIIEFGNLSPTLSKNAASKIYGRGLVDRWIKEGLIKAVKDGNHSSTMRLDRIRLEILSKTANRQTYLTVVERKQNY